MKTEFLAGTNKYNPQDYLPTGSMAQGPDFKRVLEGIQEEEQLKKACQEVEALFIKEMLKQLRSSLPQGGLIPEGVGSDIYKDMLDEEYSKLIASSRGNLGLGDLIYRQLTRGEQKKESE